MINEAYAQDNRGRYMSPEEALNVAKQDETVDNAYVDALDEYINKWVR